MWRPSGRNKTCSPSRSCGLWNRAISLKSSMLGPARRSDAGCELRLLAHFCLIARPQRGAVAPSFEGILGGISPEAGELIESAGDPDFGAGAGGSVRAVLELLCAADPRATSGAGAAGSLRIVTIARSPRLSVKCSEESFNPGL